MTPDEIRALRLRLNLTLAEFGTLLGYNSKTTTRETLICSFEGGLRQPNQRVIRLMRMIAAHGPTILIDPDPPNPQLEEAAE